MKAKKAKFIKRLFLYIILLIACVFFQSRVLYAQQNKNQPQDFTTYQKYSYLIIQYPKILTNEDRNNGKISTGFFVKRNKRLFLVSNYHVFTGVDGWKQRIENDYDSIKVRYYDTKNSPHFYTIDVTTINKNRQIVSFLNYPDIFVYEIKNLPKNAKIYSIEKYLYAKEKESNTKIVFSYQYSLAPGNDLARQIQIIKSERENPNINSLIYPNNSVVFQKGFINTEPAANKSYWQSVTNTPKSDETYQFVSAETLDKSGGVLYSYLTGSSYGKGIILNAEQGDNKVGWQFPVTTLRSDETQPVFLDANIHKSGSIIRSSLIGSLDSLVYGKGIILNAEQGDNKVGWQFPVTTLRSGETQPVFLGDNIFKSGSIIPSPFIGSLDTLIYGRGIILNTEQAENKNYWQLPVTALQSGETQPVFLGDNIFKSGSIIPSPFIGSLDTLIYGKGIVFNTEKIDNNNYWKFVNVMPKPEETQPMNSVDWLSKYSISPLSTLPSIENKSKEPANEHILNLLNFETFYSSLYVGQIIDSKELPFIILSNPKTYVGASGSPVFFSCIKIKGTNNSEWIEFAGIQSSINQELNVSIIFKAEEIIKKIDEKIKENK